MNHFKSEEDFKTIDFGKIDPLLRIQPKDDAIMFNVVYLFFSAIISLIAIGWLLWAYYE